MVRSALLRAGFQRVLRPRGGVCEKAVRCAATKASPFQRYGITDPIARRENWKAMSAESQSSWEVLGWDEDSWTHGNPCPGTEYIHWEQMTPEQLVAAESLGYTRELWEAEDETAESLFHLKEGLFPGEIVFGVTVFLVAGWNLYDMERRKKKKHQDAIPE